jgi:TIR domain
MSNLRVFISYATEDQPIADEFCKQLKGVFGIDGMVHWTFAPQFGLGVDWRPTIEDALDKADILLVISTGQSKPSHSFTGFEVGFFRNSFLKRPKMTDFESQDRLILPVAVFADMPDPVTEIQGLKLDPMVVDRACLKDRSRFVDAMQNQKVNSLARVFTRIRGILQTKIEFSDDDLAQLAQSIDGSVTALYGTIFDQLQEQMTEKIFPERKIILRLPQPHDDWRDAEIQFFFDDQSFNPCGFGPIPQGRMNWQDFLARICDEQVKASLKEAFATLVRHALNNEPNEDRHQIILPNRSRAFLVATSGIQYLKGIDEFHIHLVEIGAAQLGNYEMTRLVEALSIGLRYRHMFLEGTRSSYSTEKFQVVVLSRLKHRVERMLNDLEVLLGRSAAAGLYDGDFLALIHNYMPDGGGDFDDKAVQWEEAKEKLDAAAKGVLGETDNDALGAAKAQFLIVLKDFCAKTVSMNREFISAVFSVLKDIVQSGNDLWPFGGIPATASGQGTRRRKAGLPPGMPLDQLLSGGGTPGKTRSDA